MRDKLQAIIQAKTEEDILDAFEEYISAIPDIGEQREIPLIIHNHSSIFQDIALYGIKTLEQKKKLGFIIIKVNDHLSEKSGKKAQYDLAKALLKDNERYFDYGIFLFYDKKYNFRFSLIYNVIQENKRQYNTFKRYTYFCDSQQSNKTFKDRISKLNYTSLAEIVEAFSVEKVNEEFYRDIATWFHKLVGAKTTKTQYNTAFTLPSVDSKTNHKIYQDFAVRLIGRLVFVWFLKFKKDTQGKGLIPDALISSQAVQNYPDYYHSILEKVFFEMLNKNIRSRRDNALGACLEYSSQIPYLNGGLFEAIEEDYYEVDTFSGFSKYQNTLNIDNSYFIDIFQILERYNFTIDENSSSDIEVSVDPEMLGRIFENLLGEINPATGDTARKATGSFYTPRAIVEYMVRRSIEEYLSQHTQLDIERINLLFIEGEENDFSQQEKNQIIQALDKLKILDPACGSGAYPMGILQQIFSILSKIDPDNSLWLEIILAKLPNELLRNEIRSNPSLDYIRKLGIIESSIFGVDIQESAVEISRLRFFLSLIVDQEIQEKKENRGIEALPNLDFKFVSANTLISLNNHSRQGTLSDPEIEDLVLRLKALRSRFFNEHTEKEILKTQFVSIQKQLTQKYSKVLSNVMSKKLADWEPFEHKASDWFDPEWMFGVTEGFDIVIGNPPYIQIQKKELIPEYMSKAYKSQGYLTFKSTGDIYALFYEKGFDLLRKDGILCYITSNKWMRAGYGETLRSYFADHTIPLQLIDFGGFKVFKSATVDTNIYLAKKGNPDTYHLKAVHFKNDFKTGDSLSDYINQNSTIINKLSKDTWFIGSKAEIALKEKIEKLGKPLKDWDVKINYGIKTGLNEAFIIDEDTRARLIKEDPKSEEIIKPILRGRDIKRYGYDFANIYLIATHNGYKGVPPIRIDDYPAIKSYLGSFEPKLSKRGDKGKTPYHLRDCAYMGEFAKEKVVYSEIVREPKFFYDRSGEFFAEATSFILTGSKVKFLTAVFNSQFFTFIFKYFYSGGGLGTDGYRYKKLFLEQVPIPRLDTEQKQNIAKQIEALVDQILEVKQNSPEADTTNLESQIDELVMDLYQLTAEERDIVRGESKK